MTLANGDAPERLVFSEYHAVASPSAAYMLADARWKYHEYVGFPPELFDTNADPGEERNLAQEPGHRQTLERMAAGLRDICDPATIDRQAKDAQNALVESFGGPTAASKIGPMGASPVPG